MVEDLPCNDWRNFEGGLFHPGSSIGFFKRLVGIVNFEHWGVNPSQEWILEKFARCYKANTGGVDFERIHAVTYVNSMCFIEKKRPDANRPGQRIVAGR